MNILLDLLRSIVRNSERAFLPINNLPGRSRKTVNKLKESLEGLLFAIEKNERVISKKEMGYFGARVLTPVRTNHSTISCSR